jgi:hypothetical protein
MAPGQVAGQAWDALWVGVSAWNAYNAPGNGLNQTQIDPITWQPGSPEHVGPVTTGYSFALGVSDIAAESFTLNAPWNTIKDIELAGWFDTDNLSLTGFVDTVIKDPWDSGFNITVTSAKRGAIELANGDNIINVNYLSNEYARSNHFHIGVGNGNNTIEVHPDDYVDYGPGSVTPVPPGWSFNTEPDQTTVGIALGSGNNTVELEECSGTITMGGGTNSIIGGWTQRADSRRRHLDRCDLGLRHRRTKVLCPCYRPRLRHRPTRVGTRRYLDR